MYSFLLTILLTVAQQFAYYYYDALENWRKGAYENAMSELIFCEQLNDKDAKVKEMIGVLYEAAKQKEDAYRYYREAYRLDKENCWERYMQAERSRCLERNDAKGALRCQDEIDSHRGMDVYSAYLRMRIGELTHVKWKKQVALYDQMLEFDPSHTPTLNNYAYGLATHRGDLQRAEQMSQRAIQLDPDNATYLDTYAWILHLKGERQLALFYIRKALDKAKSDQDRAVMENHRQQIEKGKKK